MGRPWIELRDLHKARVLLLLPCNAAACVGNYFRAEVYRESGWNTWREADARLRDLRDAGRVLFGAVDSSILETAPDDPRGAIEWCPVPSSQESERCHSGINGFARNRCPIPLAGGGIFC
jgi:hypothetical protein